ncbi:MAG: hypothetical protein AB199_01350 [Parcubacteria bacterium C7867-004]|nr:MAG: hypothetical protein AB199_01350 [Parcubacteria bacterium C7867-004]
MTKGQHLPTWHEKHKDTRSVGDRLADMISAAFGSWTFMFVHMLWFFVWIVFKVEPYPFGLLTMIVSLEAIFLSMFIMISQNRQADRDRHQALDDYRTNVEAKVEIEKLQQDLSRIENEKLDKILALVDK